jgi:mono/diheme cytochrome c family protein
VALALAGGGVMLARTLRYGFSARDEPTALEAWLAATMRRHAVPADLRDKRNPVPLTPAVLAEARAHFADHCASCHGNDGRGQTAMGPNFYPKVPDMTREATQSQSDGALFATIENGIRLTGMPAWGDGTAASAYGSWTLVHFIRHLPQLTAEEIAEMETLNPRPPAEQDDEAFLAGEDESPAPAATGHHH